MPDEFCVGYYTTMNNDVKVQGSDTTMFNRSLKAKYKNDPIKLDKKI